MNPVEVFALALNGVAVVLIVWVVVEMRGVWRLQREIRSEARRGRR